MKIWDRTKIFKLILNHQYLRRMMYVDCNYNFKKFLTQLKKFVNNVLLKIGLTREGHHERFYEIRLKIKASKISHLVSFGRVFFCRFLVMYTNYIIWIIIILLENLNNLCTVINNSCILATDNYVHNKCYLYW